jgi:hypothetical protein
MAYGLIRSDGVGEGRATRSGLLPRAEFTKPMDKGRWPVESWARFGAVRLAGFCDRPKKADVYIWPFYFRDVQL